MKKVTNAEPSKTERMHRGEEQNGKDLNQGLKNLTRRNHVWKNHRDEEERETREDDPKQRKKTAKDPMVESMRRQRTGKTKGTKETGQPK